MSQDKQKGQFYAVGEYQNRGVTYKMLARYVPGNDRYIFKDTDLLAGSENAAHNLTHSVVDRLFHFGLLGNHGRTMVDAADRLLRDFEDAGLRQQMGFSYSPTRAKGEREITDKMEGAHWGWRNAMAALGKYSGIVSGAVCHGEQPGKVIPLRNGLLRLASHYGFFRNHNILGSQQTT